MDRIKFGEQKRAEVFRKREGAEALANLCVVHVKIVTRRTARGRVNADSGRC